jgi:hypothetical protein
MNDAANKNVNAQPSACSLQIDKLLDWRTANQQAKHAPLNMYGKLSQHRPISAIN